MSLATAGIECTVSPPLLGAMEDCSIVRGPQLQRLFRQNSCMSGQRHMFPNTHVPLSVERSRRSQALATRRQSSAKYVGEMQTATDGRTWPP